MPRITPQISIPDTEIEISAIRAQGAGGQNVNKVSSAVHLRFNIHASSLPETCKQRLLALKDRRLSRDGTIIIKAQKYRSQDKNREEALRRLDELINSALATRKTRKPTKPTRGSQARRLDRKNKHSRQKALRGKVFD